MAITDDHLSLRLQTPACCPIQLRPPRPHFAHGAVLLRDLAQGTQEPVPAATLIAAPCRRRAQTVTSPDCLGPQRDWLLRRHLSIGQRLSLLHDLGRP